MSQCPVDHAALPASPAATHVDHRAPPPTQTDACPVDHTARSTWTNILPSPSASAPHSSDALSSPSSGAPRALSNSRETSSIPRTGDEKWVYPSEAQFFSAMARKNHNPQVSDMKVVVPIHNAVNERAWGHIQGWEAGRGGDACGGVRLVSFKGRPRDLTPKARILSLLGYAPPFDRHDWVVDRCGTRIRYVIDFYSGRSPLPGSSAVSFYLDVRPALDSWEGVKMRTSRLFGEWTTALQQTFSSPSPPASSTSAKGDV
ncbi:cytochrome c and c1 heme-lyase [Auriscalpium vulgare]|uniref:Cytochrome c and c1 heme-lyase n=1 Tax=Auriscalpium vulgare TaxID=40419 RepID=A0ACB8RUI5_9AGAM|nr:cytochrome c and c1 heme-lyase [Auriscalpium vulgare]